MNIASARLYLVTKRPYLATALYSLIPVEVAGLGTMAVDKYYRLYYDPDLNWNPMEVASVLYHEIQHLLRDHPGRGETFNAGVFNRAADCEINDDIKDENQWQLPVGVIYPDTYHLPEGKLAEYYYEQMMKDPQKFGIPQSGDGNGDGDGDGANGGGKVTGGKCGSAATGQSEDYELPGNQGQKVTPTEGSMIARKVAEDIRKEKQKGIGNIPGSWERWADEILSPKVNWRNELRASIYNSVSEVAGMIDYTYRRPSRRQSAFGKVVVPSLTQPVVKVACVVDTSGSMGSEEVEQAIAEVGGILKALGTNVGITVLSVDAAVHTCQKVFSARQVTPVGGGGTDMGIGIAKAMELKPKPDVIVVLTDGYTPWPDKSPKAKVIVGIIGGSGDGVPAWAKTIMIENRDEKW